MTYEYIGIIGHDHCGSTIFSRMLGEINGIECVGEIHWLIDAPKNGSIPMRAGWSVSRKCAVHGENCSVFTDKFITKDFSGNDLYRSVREVIGEKIVVSTDKYPEIYERFLHPGEMLGIVLFKHPYAAVTSDVLTNRRSFESSLNLWARDYCAMIEWSRRFCRDVLCIEYNDFATKYNDVIKMICGLTGNDVIEIDGELTSDYHFIGGNAPARKTSIIKADNRWKEFLGADKISIIDNDEKARETLMELIKMRDKSWVR